MNIVEISVTITYKGRRRDSVTTSVIPNIPVEDVLDDFIKQYQEKQNNLLENPFYDGVVYCDCYQPQHYHFDDEKLAFYFESPIDLQLVQTYVSLRLDNYYNPFYGYEDIVLDLDTFEDRNPLFNIDPELVVTWETLDKHIEKYMEFS